MTNYDAAMLRLAQLSDIPAIASLEATYYAGNGYPADFLYQALAQWPEGLIVAQQGDQIVGYALVAPAQQQDEYWLMAALVNTDGRGQGLGKQLCLRSIQSCRDAGGKCLWLSVAPHNEIALNLYCKLGFRERGLHQDFLGPGEHRLVMQLPLD